LQQSLQALGDGNETLDAQHTPAANPVAQHSSPVQPDSRAGLRAMENQMDTAAAEAARAAGAGLVATGATTDGRHLLAGGHPPAVVVATALQPVRDSVGLGSA